MRLPNATSTLALSLVLAACGGGGDGAAGAAGAGGSTGVAGAAGSGAGAGTSAGASGNAGASGGGAAGSAAMGGAAGSSGSGGSGGACAPDGGGVWQGCVGAGPYSRLSVNGPAILDPAGKPIVLKGWNWGQWGYVLDQDGADNAKQGASVVRIPLRWWGVYEDQPPGFDPVAKIDSRSDGSPGHIECHHLDVLDAMITQAACAGLWVVLFVDSNCGQASAANGPASYCGTAANGEPKNVTNDAASAEMFAQVWEFLANRYKGWPRVAMYELLPEPQMSCADKKSCDWAAAPSFYAPLIDRVRKIDPTTPILIGPNRAYDITRIDTAFIDKPGLIYTGDFLSFGASHPEYVMQFATAFRDSKQVPLFIQQVGVKKSDQDAQARLGTILSTLNQNGLGWTWWTYREKTPAGDGFAPFWLKSDGTWASDPQWLKLITDHLQ
jgi:hypothetical protein